MIPYDKRLHFEAGIIAALFIYLVGGQLLGMILVAAMAGLVKEIIDKEYRTGIFDKLDLLATAAGGIFIGVLFYFAGLTRLMT